MGGCGGFGASLRQPLRAAALAYAKVEEGFETPIPLTRLRHRFSPFARLVSSRERVNPLGGCFVGRTVVASLRSGSSIVA